MATIINPITTVLMTAEEFESGNFSRFPFKYIIEPNGSITYRTSYTCNRYIASSAAKIPGLAVNAAEQAKPSVNEFQALAYGELIPIEFLGQIEQFFKDVMKLNNGGGNFEAQTFIVWNDHDKEYRILIPEQKVTTTRVDYDIQDILEDGDHIIVDIHSHNTMGAFYSGTDDADDKKNSWISGVMGKLNTDTTQMVFRFNDGTGGKYPMTVNDIFTSASYTTPKEWLDKVSISRPAPVSFPKFNGQKPAPYAQYSFPEVDKRGHYVTDEPNDMFQGIDRIGLPPSLDDEVYEFITDAINELDHAETKKVLEGSIAHMRNKNFCPNLTDRESQAFIEISTLPMYYNNDIILNVLEEVKGAI